MTKAQALSKLAELQNEEQELRAEEANIRHVESLSVSTDSSRAEEVRHRCSRMWKNLQNRIKNWGMKMAEFEQELRLMPGYAT